MTTTINGHRPDVAFVTDGDDARVCVRASENPAQTPDPADQAGGSAFTPVHTRAIPHDTDIRPPKRLAKIGDFASTHVGDAKAAVAASWFGRDRPAALYDAAGRVAPGKGEAGNWLAWTGMTAAGLLRLLGLSLCYLVAFCFDGRIRATVTTALIACAMCAHAALN